MRGRRTRVCVAPFLSSPPLFLSFEPENVGLQMGIPDMDERDPRHFTVDRALPPRFPSRPEIAGLRYARTRSTVHGPRLSQIDAATFFSLGPRDVGLQIFSNKVPALPWAGLFFLPVPHPSSSRAGSHFHTSPNSRIALLVASSCTHFTMVSPTSPTSFS